ncbi:MAG: hypothetical protein GF341_02725 [candidate division Zixibacteria bacterium]|nr:hypothetical protein [candidate division Zixibacteria bacterium]
MQVPGRPWDWCMQRLSSRAMHITIDGGGFMVRRVGVWLALGLLVIALCGCSEENITQVIDSKGSVYGRIAYDEPGVEIQLWQANMAASTMADDEGYFAIYDVNPGLYTVMAVLPDGTERTVYSVSVSAGESTDLHTIEIQNYEPIVLTPTDGQTGVLPLFTQIRLSASEAIDLGFLDEAVTFDPPLSGSWSGDSQPRQTLVFTPSTQLQTNTQYTITVGPNLKYASGDSLGETITSQFRTQVFQLTGSSWRYGSTAPPELEPDFSGSLLNLEFNAQLDRESLEDNLTISPPVVFQTTLQSSDSRLIVHIVDGLTSSTEYDITLTGELSDRHGATMESNHQWTFGTKPFVLEERRYPYGVTDVPLDARDDLISFRYNLPLDTSSVRSSVAITPPVAFAIRQQYSYNARVLAVRALETLAPNTTYTIIIDGNLAAVDGATIGTTEGISFTTEPMQIEIFRVYSEYSYGSSDSIVDPDGTLGIDIRFNADVDADLFNAAASLSPSIEGFWYRDSTYSGVFMTFFQTSQEPLMADTVYLLTIDGDAPLIDDVTIGTDIVRRILVRPVKVTNVYPSIGTRSFYTHYRASFTFNVSMDRTSTEDHIIVTNAQGTEVPVQFAWPSHQDDEEVEIRPEAGWESGHVYFVTIDAGALSASGAVLKVGAQTFFQIE